MKLLDRLRMDAGNRGVKAYLQTLLRQKNGRLLIARKYRVTQSTVYVLQRQLEIPARPWTSFMARLRAAGYSSAKEFFTKNRDMTFRAMAEKLGCSAKTVLIHYHRTFPSMRRKPGRRKS